MDCLASIGLRGTVYQCFASYLADRTHSVWIQNCCPESSTVPHGVPQCSVLGPLLFIIYLLPLGNIFRHYGINFHCYADDTQLYVSTKHTSTVPSSTLIACLHDLQVWMTNNNPKFNSSKIKLFLIGTKTTLSKINFCSIPIADTTIPVSTQIKSLGVIPDSSLSFSHHINKQYIYMHSLVELQP